MNISNEDVVHLTCYDIISYGLGLALEDVANIALHIQLSTDKPKVVCMLEALQTRIDQITVSLCDRVS
jgi:hypothetical protein